MLVALQQHTDCSLFPATPQKIVLIKMKRATHPQNIWMNRVSNHVLAVQDGEFKVREFVSRLRVNDIQIESSGV